MGPNSGHNVWTVEFSFEYCGPITDVYNNDSVNIGAVELRQTITEPFFYSTDPFARNKSDIYK